MEARIGDVHQRFEAASHNERVRWPRSLLNTSICSLIRSYSFSCCTHILHELCASHLKIKMAAFTGIECEKGAKYSSCHELHTRRCVGDSFAIRILKGMDGLVA